MRYVGVRRIVSVCTLFAVVLGCGVYAAAQTDPGDGGELDVHTWEIGQPKRAAEGEDPPVLNKDGDVACSGTAAVPNATYAVEIRAADRTKESGASGTSDAYSRWSCTVKHPTSGFTVGEAQIVLYVGGNPEDMVVVQFK